MNKKFFFSIVIPFIIVIFGILVWKLIFIDSSYSDNHAQKPIIQCNDFFCAEISSSRLIQLKTHTTYITNNIPDLTSISQRIYNSDGILLDLWTNEDMTCDPSNCDKFPLQIKNVGNYSLEISAKKGDEEKKEIFNIEITKYPNKTKYYSYDQDSIKKYRILFAINKEYYDKEGQNLINSGSSELVRCLNYIFSKNTKIRFENIGIIKYDDKSLKDFTDMDSLANNYNADKVLFIWINSDMNDPNRPSLFSAAGNVFDKKYISVVWNENFNIFNTPSDTRTIQDYGTLLHEIGHTFNLGFPEQYWFQYYDCNPNEPKLEHFIYHEDENPYDPMNYGIDWDGTKEDFMFSGYNAAILNNISYSDLTWEKVQNYYIDSYLNVVDGKGNPVQGALTIMYCVQKVYFYPEYSCKLDDEFHLAKEHRDSKYGYTYNDPEPVKVYTDKEGKSKIPFESGCLAYSIKAEKDNKKGATYVNLIDSRSAKFEQNKDIYIKELTIE
ncbi:MAG: hypothetical protein NTY11_01465 [Candidatus Parcubacteria bacterium]|nr:hypothetical protein [Candidatus Parcubacteria bacterium]